MDRTGRATIRVAAPMPATSGARLYGHSAPLHRSPRSSAGFAKEVLSDGHVAARMEKKMRPFPPSWFACFPPPPPNCVHGFIDGVAVVYDRRTRIIVDTIDLISAIAGH